LSAAGGFDNSPVRGQQIFVVKTAGQHHSGFLLFILPIAKSAQVLISGVKNESVKSVKSVVKSEKKIKIRGKYSKIIKNFKKSYNPLSVLLL